MAKHSKAPAVEEPKQKKYKVLNSFTDSEDVTASDNKNVYWAGKELYPRDGYKPTAERIEYLQGEKNAFKKPVISSEASE